MTQPNEYPLHPEWPHINAMRVKLLADIAIAQAIREGYSHTGTEEIIIEEISDEDNQRPAA